MRSSGNLHGMLRAALALGTASIAAPAVFAGQCPPPSLWASVDSNALVLSAVVNESTTESGGYKAFIDFSPMEVFKGKADVSELIAYEDGFTPGRSYLVFATADGRIDSCSTQELNTTENSDPRGERWLNALRESSRTQVPVVPGWHFEERAGFCYLYGEVFEPEGGTSAESVTSIALQAQQLASRATARYQLQLGFARATVESLDVLRERNDVLAVRSDSFAGENKALSHVGLGKLHYRVPKEYLRQLAISLSRIAEGTERNALSFGSGDSNYSIGMGLDRPHHGAHVARFQRCLMQFD
ncbi:MAG: hypothetical protein AAF184_18360 [Pseudomonadota bacterium]